MAHEDKPLFLLFFLNCMIMINLLFVSYSSGLSLDSQILLQFKSTLSNASALSSWDNETTPCNGNAANWAGVLCNEDTIWGLQLENMGLKGSVNMDVLAELKDLRTLSLMNNNFEGPIPNLRKLGALKSVFLSNNHFSGDIPSDEFAEISSLKKVHLAENNFTGAIPSSLLTLSKLMELRLEGNRFEGEIPNFQQTGLQNFNVSNNALTGPIPLALSKLDSSSYSGNKGLCGEPLDSCDGTKSKLSPRPSPNLSAAGPSSNVSEEKTNPKPDPNPNPDPNTSSPRAGSNNSGQSNSTLTIVIIAVVAALALVAIIAVIFILRRRKQQPESIEAPPPVNLQKKSGVKEAAAQGSHVSSDISMGGKKAADTAKLSFVRDDRERFDLQELLKSSAEILGSGCFGSSYKASLHSGAMMVVKRFKQMNNVGREEFQEHMRRLGRLRHSNLLPLVAYYYRKEEKLLVSEFVQRGSLAVHLHGHHSLGQPGLDWPTRLKIVKGVAKGLSYLYKELPSLIAPHGHLKSSNVLLKDSFDPVLTDYGLIPVINQESAQELMVAYKSPESVQYGRITKKTDVWGLGILILEILTGKFAANSLQQGKKSEVDLASWVKSVVGSSNGGSKSEVFDKDMGGTRNSEGEMNKLLKIGLACCEPEVEKRLELKEAVERIEELKEKDGDEDFYSSYASEADIRSSRGKSDDFSYS